MRTPPAIVVVVGKMTVCVYVIFREWVSALKEKIMTLSVGSPEDVSYIQQQWGHINTQKNHYTSIYLSI